jgi:hypothetical protein
VRDDQYRVNTGSTNDLPAFLTMHHTILINQGRRIAEHTRRKLEANAVFSAIRLILGIVPVTTDSLLQK